MTKLSLIFVFLFAASAFGQSPTPGFSDSDTVKPARAVKPNEAPRTLDEMKAQAKASKTNGDLIFVYDKFKDESVVVTKPQNLVSSWEGAMAIVGSSGLGSGSTRSGTGRWILITVQSRFTGTTLRETPDKFLMIFDGTSPDWQFLKTGDTLYLLFDGDKRMQLEAEATDHDVKSYNRVDEKIAYIITREQLASLVAAQKVEIRVGEGTPREIKAKIRAAWKAVLEVTKLDAAK